MASQWSERHAAYASGLGTFGLCDGLITPKGKAVRFASVVTRIKVPPTQRPYKDHHAYCLHYAKGICGMCITAAREAQFRNPVMTKRRAPLNA